MDRAADAITIAAVLGSVTPPGRLRTAVAQALARAEQRQGASTQLLDLAELRIAFADGRPPSVLGDDTAAVIETLAAADGVLLATPVYRGSLTGALKNLLDHVPLEALRGKPTALVAMGAGAEHFLGADRHLRDVLSFFGAAVTPVATYLKSSDFVDGAPSPAAAAELDQQLDGLLTLVRALGGAGASLGPPPLAARRPG